MFESLQRFCPLFLLIMVIIHCKPEYLDEIKSKDLGWSYSPQFGITEIDVMVPDQKYDPNHYLVDPDEQLCDYYDIDYDFVNCIEAA